MNAESICQDTRVARRSQHQASHTLDFFFAGIAFNIYTKEITCHLVSVLQIVLSSGSLEKDVFRKWKSAII